MGLPWIQVAAEVIEHAAPELAVALDWNEDSALAGLVRMFRWAADRCPDDRPPSASDVVKGPYAGKLLAKVMRWEGAPLALMRALEEVSPEPIIERLEDGISFRIRGLDRYDAAWRKANPAKWMEWRNRNGLPAEPEQNAGQTVAVQAPKIEIEIESKKLPSEAVAAPAVEKLPRVVEPPDTPPETWVGEEFERWAQSRRQAAGLIPEKRLKPPVISGWFSAATMTPGVTVAALKAGFLAFGADPFWEKQGYPLRAFMSQWEKYTRAEVRHAAAG